MRKFLLPAIAVLAVAFFSVSCVNNHGTVAPRTLVNLATVDNPNTGINYIFTLDSGTRMSISSTDIFRYRPETGQRILAAYNIVQRAPESANYDFNVHLRNVYEVLTKGIVELTDENEAAIGDDPYESVRLWIGSDWLNVEFTVRGSGRSAHYINLVQDNRTPAPDDGKIHLQLRQNADGDISGRRLWGLASFNLTDLQEAGQTEVTIVVNVNLLGSGTGRDFELTYKFNDPGEESESANIDMEQEQLDIR